LEGAHDGGRRSARKGRKEASLPENRDDFEQEETETTEAQHFPGEYPNFFSRLILCFLL
jgi:hypothetical protein